MTDNNSNTASSSSFPPSDWVETTLGEVVFPVSETFNFKGKDKVHFLNTGDILEGKLLHQNLSDISSLPGQAKKTFQQNDILFSEIRPVNKRYMFVNFDSSNSVASTKLMVLRGKKNIDINFIYNLITSNNILQEFQIIAESRSGTFPQITFESIANFPILLPPLPEQQAIVSVLSAFDDKIELLREENKTLEELGQVIFKEWFGKYGVDDALPEGWRVGKLGEVVKFVQGTQVLSEYQIEEQKENYDKFLRIVDYMSNFSEKPRYIPKKDSNTYCNEDEIIMVRYGEVGFVGRRMAGVFANNLFKISPKEPMNNDFLNYFLKSNDIQQYIKNNSAGSALPAIKHSTVGDIELVIPPKNVLEEFREFAQKTERKILDNNSQIQSLARSRDELLPRLMSGEVRVEF